MSALEEQKRDADGQRDALKLAISGAESEMEARPSRAHHEALITSGACYFMSGVCYL